MADQEPDQRRGRSSTRALRTAGFAVLPAALVTAALLVSTSSYAAFNAKTSDTANTFTGGTVTLQHDAPSGTGSYSATSTAALFPSGTTSGSGGLQPGGSVTRCIDVRSTGALPSGEVRLYASVPTGSIASRITLTVVEGSSGST